MIRVSWHSLADLADAAEVEIDGFAAQAGLSNSHFVVLPEATCCAGCMPRDPLGAVEVFANSPVPLRGQALRLTGTWRVASDNPSGWRYQLRDARLREPPGWAAVTRRNVLAAGPLMCLAAGATDQAQPRTEDVRRAMQAATTIDIHSHAGGIASVARMRSGTGFEAVAAPMRQGGMAVICWAVVSDGPTNHVASDGRIHPYRDPAPGELYEYAELAFGRVLAMAREQNLGIVTSAAGLRAAKQGIPSVIIAAEGADFLEGHLSTDALPSERTRRHPDRSAGALRSHRLRCGGGSSLQQPRDSRGRSTRDL